ncbi:hypothetical protein O999_05055 [Pseudomonas putida LF54]|nr:hypothetical protein O999_05055 [Pseudomonas putida LF54]
MHAGKALVYEVLQLAAPLIVAEVKRKMRLMIGMATDG